MVTYATSAGANGTRGFALRYDFGNNGGYPASINSKDMLPNAALGSLKHLPSGGPASKWDLSVMAFVPPSTCTAQERVRLLVSPIKTDATKGFLYLFEFINSKWIPTGRML